MAFYFLTGVMGSGKSYMGAELVLKCLKEGGTVLANAAIGANGQAVVSLSGLSIGNHVVVATYSGDAANAPSTATLVQQVIAAGPGGNMPSAPALSTFALACIFLILVVAGVAALWHRRKAL